MSGLGVLGLCVLCLVIGAFFGVLIVSLCAMAGEADDSRGGG